MLIINLNLIFDIILARFSENFPLCCKTGMQKFDTTVSFALRRKFTESKFCYEVFFEILNEFFSIDF